MIEQLDTVLTLMAMLASGWSVRVAGIAKLPVGVYVGGQRHIDHGWVVLGHNPRLC